MNSHLDDRAARPSTSALRHHVLMLTAVALASAMVLAVAVNNALQREWLVGKWLYRMPSGLVWLAACAALNLAAAILLCALWRTGRWRSTSYAPLRWLLTALLGAAIVSWSIEPPTVVYDAHLALSAAAAAWSVAVALLAPRADAREPRLVRLLDLGLFQLAIFVFAAELGMRALRRIANPPLLASRGTDVDARLRSLRLAAGSFHLGFPVNADGYVDVAPEEAARAKRRVACIGDSFSVGVVPHHLHYTTRAESAFDELEVYNIGVVNSGPREYARMLELSALPLEPQLIVIAIFVGNDIDDARRERLDMRASWMDRDEVLLLQVPMRIWRVARERRAGAGIAPTGNVNMFGLPRDQAFTPAELERLVPWLADPMSEPADMTAERFAYVESVRVGITQPGRRRYDEFFSALEDVRARAGRIPLAFLIFPDQFQVEDTLWAQVSAHAPGAERDLPQRLITAWLDERALPYVDLLPRLRAVTPLADGELHVYHLRDTHFNARGNAIAGTALVELVERCGAALRSER